MITTKEIVDLLVEDQESHEAVVRALHYNYEDFMNWSWANVKYVAYALGSLRIKLPIYWDESDNPSIPAKDIAFYLWSEIDNNREEILQQFNQRFNVPSNR